jgi:hypothetical protein
MPRTARGAVTLSNIKDGSSPIACTLSNQSHTFAADADGLVSPAERALFSCVPYVYAGIVCCTYDASNLGAAYTYRITASDSSEWTTQIAPSAEQVTITSTAVPSGSNNRTGLTTLTITVKDGAGTTTTLTTVITLSKNIAGTAGQVISLTPSRQTFKYSAAGTTTDGTVTIGVITTGAAGSLTATYALNNGAWLPLVQGSLAQQASALDIDRLNNNDIIAITPTNFGAAQTMSIKVSGTDCADVVTLIRIQDAAPGADGAPGSNGTDGSNGAPGSAGANGTNGAPGADGAAGKDGTNGVAGADGITYTIMASPNIVILENNGTFTPPAVTFTAKKKTGAQAEVDYPCTFKIYLDNASTSAAQSSAGVSSFVYSIPTAVRTITCKIYDGVTLITESSTLVQIDYSAAILDASKTASATAGLYSDRPTTGAIKGTFYYCTDTTGSFAGKTIYCTVSGTPVTAGTWIVLAGDVYAENIAGVTITGKTLSGGSILGGTIAIGSADAIFKANATEGIYLGNAARASAKFRVSQSGILECSEAVINGIKIDRGGSDVSSNIAVGVSTLVANTSGSYNVAVGDGALVNNTTGMNNIALGNAAAHNNSVGGENIAIGTEALWSNLVGTNTAIGAASLRSNTTGTNNTAVGFNSLGSNITGVCNTVLGNWTLSQGTGSYNVVVGSTAGHSVTTGNNLTLIGADSDVSSGALTNSTAIGSLAKVTKSNQVVLGNSSVTETVLRGATTDNIAISGAATWKDGSTQTSSRVIGKTGGGNLLTNASFESWASATSATDWGRWSSPGGSLTVAQSTDSKSGYAVQITMPAGSATKFYHLITLSMGVAYTAVCWVKRLSGTGTAILCITEETEYADLATVVLPVSGVYEMIVLTFTSAAAYMATFNIRANDANGSVWVIDSCIMQTTAEYNSGVSAAPQIPYFPVGANVLTEIRYTDAAEFTKATLSLTSDDFLQYQNNNHQLYSIFQVKSPNGTLNVTTDSDGREATMAFMRDDGIGNVEFFDLYNNGYFSESQYGIRIQCRGTGQYRDFVYDQYNGVVAKQTIMRLFASKNVSIGPLNDDRGLILDVRSDSMGIQTPKTPATQTSAGVIGQICWDVDYIYVCVDTNFWKRTALATW